MCIYVYVSAGRCPTARAGILSESEIEKCSRPMRYENDYIICHALYYMLHSLLDLLPLKIDSPTVNCDKCITPEPALMLNHSSL